MWNYNDNLDNYGLLTKYREETEEEAEAFNYISAINENHRTPFGKIFADYFVCLFYIKVEKILKGSLDSIPSPLPSAKIQTMGGKVCLRCKDKILLGVVKTLLKTKNLLTSPSNVLPYYFK